MLSICINMFCSFLGEYTMEYSRYAPASLETTDRVVGEWQKKNDGSTNSQGGKKKKKN